MSAWDGLEEAVAIADAGTFVGAAAILGTSTSHISRAIARLEERLDTHLFHRTTRHVQLTNTGHAFVDQCRHILQERDELLAQVNGSGEPQGDLRITCSIALGERFVAPIVRQFTNTHPRLSVSIDLTNRVVDLVGEGYDIGIRTGHIADPRLIGREIATRPIEVCAAPSYLQSAGMPKSIEDLARHQCLVGTSEVWHFLENGNPRTFAPRGRWKCNSGAAVVDAAASGMGICQLPAFYVRQHIEDGRLMPLLEHLRGEPEPILLVYPQRRHLLPKVRGLGDLLASLLQSALDAP